ncbi:MAG: nucleotidyltransferase family protein [Candidatus Paceibacteria bacterium]
MDELTRVKTILSDHMEEFRREYNVEELGVFGSTARGDNRTDSDVDILVSFNGKVTLFSFAQLELHLEELLGREVDLVMKQGLKPMIKESVLKSTQYVEA